MSMSRPTTQPQLPQLFHHPSPPPQTPPSQTPPLSPHPQPPLSLDLTIISGKHLKNVNWKNNGTLKPYAIFWVDPDHKLTTKSDDCSDTKPVWNQRFTLPIPTSTPFHHAAFTLEVFHSRASETSKPFVGSLTVPLASLPDPNDHTRVRTYDLLRPSGRPHGKIKLKLALKLHHQQSFSSGFDYQNTLPNSYYYSSAPPTQAAAYSFYAGYYPPPPPVWELGLGSGSGRWVRSLSERSVSQGYGAAPSAPVDYSPYDVRTRPGMGAGFGVRVGALGGMMGGLALDEEKVGHGHGGERVEDNYLGGAASSAKDDFSEYRAEY